MVIRILLFLFLIPSVANSQTEELYCLPIKTARQLVEDAVRANILDSTVLLLQQQADSLRSDLKSSQQSFTQLDLQRRQEQAQSDTLLSKAGERIKDLQKDRDKQETGKKFWRTGAIGLLGAVLIELIIIISQN